MTAAQCTADGGTVSSKNVAPSGTPDLVPDCNGITISDSATPPSTTVSTAQCTADGGTVGSKNEASDGTPDLVPDCNGVPVSG